MTKPSAASMGFWLAIGHMLAFADRSKIAGLLPLIRHDIPMSDAVAGAMLGTIFTLGYVIGLVALAVLPPRFSNNATWRILVGVGLGAAASLATGFVRSLTELILVRAVLGFGQALFIPAALTLLADASVVLPLRTRQMARFLAAASLGRGAGLLLVAAAVAALQWFVAAGAPWRWVFAVTTVPNLILLAVLWHARERSVAAPTVEAGTSIIPPTGVKFAYLLLATAPFVLIQGFVGWLPTLLHERGLTIPTAATVAGVQAIVAGAGGQLTGGTLMRRLGTGFHIAPLVVVAAVILASGFIGVGVAADGIAGTVAAFVVAYYLLAIALFGAIFGWQQLLSADGAMSGNGTLMGTVTFVGVGLGPILTGAIAGHLHNLGAALAATATTCAIWSILTWAAMLMLYRRRAEPRATL